MGSRLLFALLLAATAALAVMLYRADAKNRAPLLPSYDWLQHRDVLLVVHPLADSCSTCNLSIAGWTEKGFAHKLDVLVVASQPNSELSALRKTYPQKRLTIINDADKSLIQRFSSGDKIGGVRVRNGRILQRQTGGFPSEDFLAQRR